MDQCWNILTDDWKFTDSLHSLIRVCTRTVTRVSPRQHLKVRLPHGEVSLLTNCMVLVGKSRKSNRQ